MQEMLYSQFRLCPGMHVDLEDRVQDLCTDASNPNGDFKAACSE